MSTCLSVSEFGHFSWFLENPARLKALMPETGTGKLLYTAKAGTDGRDHRGCE